MVAKMIKVENLNVNYQRTPVLTNVNFTVVTGQLIGIIGPNGAGKSSLMKAMLGLVNSSGTAQLAEVPFENLKNKVAYIKQGSDYDLTFPILVKDVVMLGMHSQIGLFRRPNAKHKQLVEDALKRVEMLEFANRQIAELSGGQWQRVLIARLLVQDAEVLFLDEPFTGVDVASESKIMEILRQLRDAGKTIIMIYHNIDNAKDYFDEVVLINKTVAAFGKASVVLTDENLKKLYLIRSDV